MLFSYTVIYYRYFFNSFKFFTMFILANTEIECFLHNRDFYVFVLFLHFCTIKAGCGAKGDGVGVGVGVGFEGCRELRREGWSWLWVMRGVVE